MKCVEAQKHIEDYWQNNPRQSPLSARAEAHLAKCESCAATLRELSSIWDRLQALPEEEPVADMHQQFRQNLESFGRGLRTSRTPSNGSTLSVWWACLRLPTPVWIMALGAVVFLAGVCAGSWLFPKPQPDLSVQFLHKEIVELRQLMAAWLLQHPSATERLRGVDWALQADDDDNQTRTSLLKLLEQDSNVNVRLAAAKALGPFVNNPVVRNRVRELLSREDSPLVQVQLIDHLVQHKEQQSTEALQAIIQNDQTHQAVRRHAQWGLQKLI